MGTGCERGGHSEFGEEEDEAVNFMGEGAGES